MKNFSRFLLSSVLLVASLGSWAQSDPVKTAPEIKASGDQKAEHGWGQHGQRMAHRFEKHMTELKSKLALRPDQEPAWNSFVQGVRPAHPDQPVDHAKLQSLTTPERLEVHQRMMAAMQQHMQARATATQNFYTSLSDEQKKTFDKETGRWMAQHHAMNK